MIDLDSLDPEELALLDAKNLVRLKALLKEQENREKFNKVDAYSPYPWQEKFHSDGVKAAQRLLMTGNRCIPAWQPIDLLVGKDLLSVPILEALSVKDGRVLSWVDGEERTSCIHRAFFQGIHPIFRLYLSDGGYLDCTDEHQVLIASGNYHTIRELMSLSGGHHCLGTDADSLENYVLGGYQCDQPPHQALSNVQASIPLLTDVLLHTPMVSSRADGVEHTAQYTPTSLHDDLLSNKDALRLCEALSELFATGVSLPNVLQKRDLHQALQQLRVVLGALLQSKTGACLDKISDCDEACSNYIYFPSEEPCLMGGNKILAWQAIGSHPCFDIQVPDFHNYRASNVYNHNCGKTFSGASEMAYHLTGRYPDWWKGRRWRRPITAWAAGISNAKTRDIVQKETMGDPEDPEKLGTGTIPLDCIISTTRLPGVPNALQSVLVKHYTDGVYDGNSRLGFLSYEMGQDKFMGSTLDLIWLDEQPEQKIFSQCITRTADSAGQVYMTFTPEKGMTEVVFQFLNDIKPGQALTRAEWDDCPHLTEAVKEQLLAVYLPHERDMRSKGTPVMGSGLVFPVTDESIMVDDFPIPRNWPRIAGMDFGWDHPTAFVFIAVNPSDGTQYVYAAWKLEKTLPAIHAVSVREVDNGCGFDIPMAWPHDGGQHDKGSGATLADQYRAEGLNMLPTCFSNPPAAGLEEGKGGQSVDAGILAMYTSMVAGKFKVFKSLHEWFLEKQFYYREEGKIVKVKDDIMSATRYASQSARFAAPLGSNTFSGKLSLPRIEVC